MEFARIKFSSRYYFLYMGSSFFRSSHTELLPIEGL